MITGQAEMRRYADVAMRNVFQPHVQERGDSDRMRRLADVVTGCAILAVISPLMILVSLIIKLESRGPVFERYPCIRQGGHRFHILKFRTLMHDPEHRLPIRERQTQVGNFLRYTRIEDLPQLFNVLRGEMSLIDRDGRSPSFLD
jgi:lipopolysaccharide/colanic/teichoic acid biosynthesis glycosyltransferase